jgi:hypothetical protein
MIVAILPNLKKVTVDQHGSYFTSNERIVFQTPFGDVVFQATSGGSAVAMSAQVDGAIASGNLTVTLVDTPAALVSVSNTVINRTDPIIVTGTNFSKWTVGFIHVEDVGGGHDDNDWVMAVTWLSPTKLRAVWTTDGGSGWTPGATNILYYRDSLGIYSNDLAGITLP